MRKIAGKILVLAVGVVPMVFGMFTPARASLMTSISVYNLYNKSAGFSMVVTDNDGVYDTNSEIGIIDIAQFYPLAVSDRDTHIAIDSLRLKSVSDFTDELTSRAKVSNTSTAIEYLVYIAVSDTNYIGSDLVSVYASLQWDKYSDKSMVTLSWFADPSNTQGANRMFTSYMDFSSNAGVLTPGLQISTYSESFVQNRPPTTTYGYGPTSIGTQGLFSMTMLYNIDLVAGEYLYLDQLMYSEGSAHATVPEPATMLLLGSGLMGLAGYGRKKLFKK